MIINIISDYLENHFTDLLDHIGTFAFAISGIKLAAQNKFDWFGAYVVGLVTAIGGGTTRDLLLGVTPFWMLNASYLIVTGIALISFAVLKKQLMRMDKTLFLFDAIGLGLFVVVGIDKSLNAHFEPWVAVTMGMITGAIGGVIRDVLINETPLIFRREIYALACVFGGIIFFVCNGLNLPTQVTHIVTALSIIGTRLAAVHYKLQLPALQ